MESAKKRNTAQTESTTGSPSGQQRDRRAVLRMAATSSLAAAMIGVGGRTERAAAQEVPTPEELVESYKQWRFNPNGPPSELLPKSSFGGPADRNYSLKGMAVDSGPKFLQWEGQTWGINLGWTDNASAETEQAKRRWFFTKPGNDTSSVKYGETIALGNGGDPSWLRYEERTVGINLDWSSSPVFEWRLLGGEFGQPVGNDDPVAIFNSSTNNSGGEPLIFFDRTVGGDIGWPSSQTIPEALEAHLREQWKEYVGVAIAMLLGGSSDENVNGDPKREEEEPLVL